jgi:hypothetical protein
MAATSGTMTGQPGMTQPSGLPAGKRRDWRFAHFLYTYNITHKPPPTAYNNQVSEMA